VRFARIERRSARAGLEWSACQLPVIEIHDGGMQ
jgi:hypothetical protein